MKVVNAIIFLLCLTHLTLTPTQLDTQSTELIQRCNEYIQYLDELQTASQYFEQKYNDEPRFQCAACKEKKLSYGEIVGWAIGRLAQDVADENKFNTTKKVLIEMIEGLFQLTPDELLDFMLNMANDLRGCCSHCRANHWQLLL